LSFIVGCSNAGNLSKKVSEIINIPLAKTEIKNFPDTEIYVRIDEDLENEDVIAMQSGYPNQNNALIELFLALDAVKDMDPKSISLVFTYMPYSKQDKRFKDGEAVSAGTILKLVKSFKINKIFTVNLHFAKGETDFDFFNIDMKSINAAPLIAEYVKSKYGNFTAVLPGKGSSYLLSEGELLFLETRRERYKSMGKEYFGESNIVSNELGGVKGKTVLVLDDMINTGGTMAKTCELVRKNGANKVIAACIHGLFVGNAADRLVDAKVDEIISTDTIESEFSKVSVAPLIAEEIKRL